MKKTITTIAFGLLSITLSAQVPNYVPTNGLVGWWPFTGNANDGSGNNNNGVVTGAALTADRFGNSNEAYSFDGTNVITVANNANLNFQTNNIMSASFWFKTNTNQLYRSPIIEKQSGSGNTQIGYNIGLDNGGLVGNRPNVNLMAKNGFSSQWISAISDTIDNFINNNWYNIVIVYNNGLGLCYVNGILKNTITGQLGIIGNNTNALLFGSTINPGITSKKFIGQIDDIGIWNRVLTQQEITNLFNGGICYQNITVTDTLLINTGITGFNPITYKNTIKVWPNPTNDHITIDNGNIANLTGYQIKITNSLGQQVFQSAVTQQQFYVDLSTWSGNGIYFVHIIDAQGNTIDIKKIVLQ